jgi:hypothetical protein
MTTTELPRSRVHSRQCCIELGALVLSHLVRESSQKVEHPKQLFSTGIDPGALLVGERLTLVQLAGQLLPELIQCFGILDRAERK